MTLKNSHSTLRRRAGVEWTVGFGVAARRCGQDDLLVAEELAGENHPGGEQSDKGSGGNYGYHLGVPPNSLWS